MSPWFLQHNQCRPLRFAMLDGLLPGSSLFVNRLILRIQEMEIVSVYLGYEDILSTQPCDYRVVKDAYSVTMNIFEKKNIFFLNHL